VNCNPGNPGVINLQEFIIAPNDPIYIGDVATLGLAVELSEDLVQPIQVCFLFFHFRIHSENIRLDFGNFEKENRTLLYKRSMCRGCWLM